MRFVRATLIIVGIIQIGAGAIYLATPAATTAMLGVAPQAPPWFGFVSATAGARFIGYGIGMLAAARSPHQHVLWIDTMIAIQAVDLIAVLVYRANGSLPAQHFAASVVLPLLWVILLGWIRVRIHRTTLGRVEKASPHG